MLLVHAGNRVDAADRADARFPVENVQDVRTRVGRLLTALSPKGVVSAPAAGADLVVLEEAASRQVPIHVVLPLPEDEFETVSVADLGHDWVHRYRRVLDRARRTGNSLTVCGFSAGDDWYRAANASIIERALELTEAADAGRLVAFAVQPRSSTDSSVTGDFVQRARIAGLPVIRIDPGRRLGDLPTAFAVMPFGTKTHPITGRRINCDSVFDKLLVPAFENSDFNWQRADRSLDAGIIHIDMIEQLGNADLVVADLITENPNVYYELGLRHAFAAKVTVLIAPRDTSAPFDVRDIRRFPYPMAGEAITEDEAIEGWAQLEPVLATDALARARPDSPVHTIFSGPSRPLRRRDVADERAQELTVLRMLVTTAEQQGRAEELTAAVRALDELDRQSLLDADERAMLLLRLGIAFRHHGTTDQAIAVLGRADLPVDNPAYPQLHRELAMALRRAADLDEGRGQDPKPRLDQASDHLERALRASPQDPETLGITGGLNKQLAVLCLRRGQKDQARLSLERAEVAYIAGVEADPSNFYVLLNDITTARLLAQRLGGDSEGADRARALLPIAEFLTEQATRRHPDDFWAHITLAELALTRHLLDGVPERGDVVATYARTALLHPPVDYWNSVHNQLDTYVAAGDPPETIAMVREAIPSRPAATPPAS
jgi:tetratricopeptide (TPR) repeat protein